MIPCVVDPLETSPPSNDREPYGDQEGRGERDSYIRELLAPPTPLPVRPPTHVEAARHIVSALVEAGCDTFFGIPGGPVAPMFEAILQTSGARLVRSKHEAAAAFEAAGFHRATGRVP